MADYFVINSFSKSGELGVSRNVFKSITREAVLSSKHKNAVLIKEPIKVIFKKDAKVYISLHISLKRGSNVTEVCSDLQKDIAHDLEVYIESVPFEIKISVDELN